MVRAPMPPLPKNAPPETVELYRRAEAQQNREARQALYFVWGATVVMVLGAVAMVATIAH